MRARRWRGWGIDLFLWACPLAGMGVLVGAVLMSKPPRLPDKFDVSQDFGAPGRVVTALAVTCVGLPLLVALLTRRLLGFLAGACLLLGYAAGLGWVDSHRANQSVALIRVTAPPPLLSLHTTEFASQGGGVRLSWARYGNKGLLDDFRTSDVATVGGEWFDLSRVSPEQAYPSEQYPFEKVPKPLHRMGFAVAIHPKREMRLYKNDISFALALPYWFLCLLAVPLPLAWTVRLRRRRRATRQAAFGLCRNCGYDLRATPDASGATLPICPECGAEAHTAAAK